MNAASKMRPKRPALRPFCSAASAHSPILRTLCEPNQRSGSGSHLRDEWLTHAKDVRSVVSRSTSSASVRPARLAAATPFPAYPPTAPRPVRESNCTKGAQSRVTPIAPPQRWVISTSESDGKSSSSVEWVWSKTGVVGVEIVANTRAVVVVAPRPEGQATVGGALSVGDAAPVVGEGGPPCKPISFQIESGSGSVAIIIECSGMIARLSPGSLQV